MKMGTIKVDTPEAQPHVILEVEKYQKLTAEWKEPLNTSIIPYKALRESNM